MEKGQSGIKLVCTRGTESWCLGLGINANHRSVSTGEQADTLINQVAPNNTHTVVSFQTKSPLEMRLTHTRKLQKPTKLVTTTMHSTPGLAIAWG